MNHMKKIALVLSLSVAIHPVTQCYEWTTKSVLMVISGTTVLVGVVVYYLKLRENPDAKKDLVKIIPQEEYNAPSQNTPQPTEEIMLISEPEIEPTPAELQEIIDDWQPLLEPRFDQEPVVKEDPSNNPTPIQTHIHIVTKTTTAGEEAEEALSIGRLNNPFNN